MSFYLTMPSNLIALMPLDLLLYVLLVEGLLYVLLAVKRLALGVRVLLLATFRTIFNN